MDREEVLASRILIVDDLDANVLLLERILQQAGYKNYAALTDSRQVLDQFRIFQPDLILLDLMMPKMDGYAVMKQLNGWMADDIYVPILVITADASRVARQKALALGAKDFVSKPLDNVEVALRIYNLLETRRLYVHMRSRAEARSLQIAESLARLRAVSSEWVNLAGQESPASGVGRLIEELQAAELALEKLAAETGAERLTGQAAVCA